MSVEVKLVPLQQVSKASAIKLTLVLSNSSYCHQTGASVIQVHNLETKRVALKVVPSKLVALKDENKASAFGASG